jgi:hypothetical protein
MMLSNWFRLIYMPTWQRYWQNQVGQLVLISRVEKYCNSLVAERISISPMTKKCKSCSFLALKKTGGNSPSWTIGFNYLLMMEWIWN